MSLISFLSGIYMISFAASGLIFFKFYKSTGDRFFKLFGYACWLFAAERIALFFVFDPLSSLSTVNIESKTWVYLIRMIAFLIIVFAIFDKNRNSKE